jgi:hypothetical protein
MGGGGTIGGLTVEVEVMGNLVLVVISSNNKTF